MAEIKLYATNILWDVQDDDTLSKEALMLRPTLIEIPKEKISLIEDRLKVAKESHKKMTELINDINDDAVDYLSDTYGFMIESLNYEISDTGFVMDELADIIEFAATAFKKQTYENRNQEDCNRSSFFCVILQENPYLW